MPRPRVLLIDDSRTAQAALGRGPEEAGYEVLVAGDEKPVSPARLVDVVRTVTTLDGRPPHPATEP